MSQAAVAPTPIAGRLSVLDRALPLWIFLAMALGVSLGKAFPSIRDVFDALRIDTVSLPIAIGLLWMMYPVLARVKYEELHRLSTAWRAFSLSLVLNWVVGPFLMFGLAWLLLWDHPAYREGIIIVGLARCIAMVLVWNMLAKGDNDYAAVLVALNSIFQMLMFSVLGYFFISVLSPHLGRTDAQALDISMWDIARSVLIFLGVPLVAGMITRYVGVRSKGREWYEGKLLPRLGPTALWGLLFTIVVMFSMQGQKIIDLPLDILRIAVPLLVYFLIMFGVAFVMSWRLRFPYPQTSAISFTAASNNFELAIAVAVATFGIDSGQALATVVGPLIEVPVLIGLVYVALWGRRFFFDRQGLPKALGAPVPQEVMPT